MGSRLPNPQQLVPALGEVGAALFKANGNEAIARTTIGLVQLRAGQIVGSSYLVLLHTGILRSAGDTEERIAAVATWRDAPYFTELERGWVLVSVPGCSSLESTMRVDVEGGAVVLCALRPGSKVAGWQRLRARSARIQWPREVCRVRSRGGAVPGSDW
ncbi:carboxymuconolactone decarboxylase family protein [Nocardia sp. NPDC056000]|uniref:carboxymuconolactone decarboxylase family protein n=1 Tax=Nocardia sp. NPDC056000 TaxID=3345674 RepID=UPI0035DD8FF5